MRLAGKVAIVAGAGDNMGRAIPILFAQEGARLVLVSRNAGALDETARLCRAAAARAAGGEARGGEAGGGEAGVLTLAGDVTDPAVAARAVALATGTFGGLDILVNAAGGFFEPNRDLDALEPEFWSAAVGNILGGMAAFCRAAVPAMAAPDASGAPRGGAIVNLGAGFATRQMANPAYAAAKAGMAGFTRNLARRLWEQRIRVNCVSPGLIWGEWPQDRVTPPADRRPERFGTAPDVAYAVLYLASDEASWVTGQELTVDGGDDVLLVPARRRR